VKRIVAVAGALLLAGCGASSDVTLCGPCPGSGVVLHGQPAELPHASVTVCVAERPCQASRALQPLRADHNLFVQLPTGTSWSDYGGTPVRVIVRAPAGRWAGTGAFVYRPGGDGPCSCDDLVAEVTLAKVTTRRG
jgi:hypothetical protein